jgi:hypothetical protein
MRQVAANRSSWLAGSTRLWLFDLGCASFLGAGAIALVIAVVVSFFEVKTDVMPMLLNMFLASVSAAIAWQLNRFSATEWATLVPQYQRNILLQAASLFSLSLLIAITCLGMNDAFSYAESLLLVAMFGLLFIYICMTKVKAFYLSFVLYVLAPFAADIATLLPANSYFLLLLAVIFMALTVWRKALKLNWHPAARDVYLNGLEMGHLPSFQSVNLFNRLERSLHPANYFIGPMLTVLLVGMPIATLVLALGAYLLDTQLPALFMLMQFSSISCAILHWSRVQRWRAVETLFVLPGFDGQQGMVSAFMAAQYRLLGILVISVMITAGLLSLLSPLITLSVWLHYVLSTLAGCGLILGIGSMCRTAVQISATMFLVGLQSGFIAASFSEMKEGVELWFWVAWDIPLLILAFVSLWYAKYRLWRGDLLSY